MIRKFTFLIALCMLFQVANAQVQVWSDAVGQFDGGLNGWTVVADNPGVDSTWIWSSDGDVGQGAFANPGTRIASPTAGNGSVMFHYDFFTTGGVQANAPPFPYTDMISHLISPPIDISGAPNQWLELRFHQMLAKLNAAPGGPQMGVSFTQDGGTTWFPNEDDDMTRAIDCNPDLENNALFDEARSIPIPGKDLDINLPLQIRFTYAGDFYWWVLDDIEIYTRVDHETRANSFFSVAPNAQTPVDQMPEAGFLIDVENLGAAIAPNVFAKISIEDGSGSEVFNDALSYGDIEQDSLAENEPFPGMFPTDLALGSYTGIYTVETDSVESDPSNNSQSFTFRMTDSTFAKDLGGANGDATLNRTLFDTGPWSYAIGAPYYVPNGDGLFARTVSFTINNNIANDDESDITGELLFVNLYKWTEDGAFDGVASPSERELVGSGFHTVAAGDNLNRLITVGLGDGSGALEPVPLEDDTHYIVMLEYISSTDSTTLFIGTSDVLDYNARTFQDGFTDSTMVNYHQMLGWGEVLSETDFSGLQTFGSNNVPVIRLNVGEAPLYSDTKDLPVLDASAMTLSPVPAKDYINIALDLQDVATNATLEIFAADGKVIEVIDLGNTQRDTKVLSLDKFNAGTYYARFISKEGVLTKPFQVVK